TIPANSTVTVAFSPDGKTLATGSAVASPSDPRTYEVRLWDAANGAVKAALPAQTSAISTLAFSPNGGRLAVASGDRTVRIWELAAGRCEATLEGDAAR